MGKKATGRRQNSSCLQHGQGVGSDSETQNALTSRQGRTKGLNTLGGMLLQQVCSDK